MATQQPQSSFGSFWNKAGPGLFDFGIGMYGRGAGQKEAAANLNAARGPLYDQAMAASGQALSAAGSMDPNVAAAEHLRKQQGLLAGKDLADEDQVMRMLHARGMLGAATYNPGVEGVTPNGMPMNPQLAAFYAGRGARDARMAADSMDRGEAQIDRMVNRSGMLQRQATDRQTSGLEAARSQPSRSAANMNLLKGASSILKDTGILKGDTSILKDIGGMFSSGANWLGNSTGLWGQPQWFTSGSADSIDW
jgi:hypothetical protein